MKIIVFVLGLALLSWVVYNRLEGTKGTMSVDDNGNVVVQPGQQDPGKQLDNVRGAAKKIEANQNGRVDNAAGIVNE